MDDHAEDRLASLESVWYEIIEAVNAGYQVVVPKDAVAGTPDDYVEAVFEHTLRLLATIVTADEVVDAWRR